MSTLPDEHKAQLSMRKPRIEDRTHALSLWNQAKFLDSGKVLVSNLAIDVRPYWAGDLLNILVSRTRIWNCAIWELQHVAQARWRWRAAYDLFHRIRRSTLRLLDRKDRSQAQERLLYLCGVAENVAKTVYNATSSEDVFDSESADWLVFTTRQLLDCIGDALLTDEIEVFFFGSESEQHPGALHTNRTRVGM